MSFWRPGCQRPWLLWKRIAKSISMVQLFRHANRFMTCLYGADWWLLDTERQKLIDHGVQTMVLFKRLAGQAYAWNLTRWKLQPKFHFFSEVLYSLHADKSRNVPSLSPLAFATQCDEDFVGRVSQASRSVSSRTVHVRTMQQKYLLSLRVHS